MKAKNKRKSRQQKAVNNKKDTRAIKSTQERKNKYLKILQSMITFIAVIFLTFSSFLWLGVFQVFECLHIHQDDVQPFLHEHGLE